MAHTLFEATLDDENNFNLAVNIPDGVQLAIKEANFIEVLGTLTEVAFFCINLQRKALSDVAQGIGVSKLSDTPDSKKEDIH